MWEPEVTACIARHVTGVNCTGQQSGVNYFHKGRGKINEDGGRETMQREVRMKTWN